MTYYFFFGHATPLADINLKNQTAKVQLSERVLDVLWGQPIKLIRVVSTSEIHEY